VDEFKVAWLPAMFVDQAGWQKPVASKPRSPLPAYWPELEQNLNWMIFHRSGLEF
jgi:hypothetical protein